MILKTENLHDLLFKECSLKYDDEHQKYDKSEYLDFKLSDNQKQIIYKLIYKTLVY